MTEAESAAPEPIAGYSLIALALRVLRGELTEAQAIAMVRGEPGDKHD